MRTTFTKPLTLLTFITLVDTFVAFKAGKITLPFAKSEKTTGERGRINVCQKSAYFRQDSLLNPVFNPGNPWLTAGSHPQNLSIHR